jgi:hypothetical protein
VEQLILPTIDFEKVKTQTMIDIFRLSGTKKSCLASSVMFKHYSKMQLRKRKEVLEEEDMNPPRKSSKKPKLLSLRLNEESQRPSPKSVPRSGVQYHFEPNVISINHPTEENKLDTTILQKLVLSILNSPINHQAQKRRSVHSSPCNNSSHIQRTRPGLEQVMTP